MVHDPKSQYSILCKIKENLTYDRGVLINQYVETKNHSETIGKIVEVQTRIEAISRIISEVGEEVGSSYPNGLSAFYKEVADNPEMNTQWYPGLKE